MRIGGGKVPYHGSAIRVPYKYKRAFLTELGESVSQFEIHLRKRAGFGARIAPGIPGPIVSADACKPRNPILHQDPVKGKISQSIFHNDGRAAFPRTVHMKKVAS
jgi:hypothetical protein